MKVGDLVALRKSHTSPAGLVMDVEDSSSGLWALVLWPDGKIWHNWRDLEVISEIG